VKIIMKRTIELILTIVLALRLIENVSSFSRIPQVVPTRIVKSNHESTFLSVQKEFGALKVRNNVDMWCLFSKKAKSSGVANAPSKKIQVKMLKYVAGTGHVGEIVQVTPAFFQNKLRPEKSAVVISDDEVQQESAELDAKEKKRNAEATDLKEKLENIELVMTRKAGPDGHLFGGIGPKMLMDELIKKVDNPQFFEQKGVKIVSVIDSDGGELSGDIKQTGDFSAKVSLTKEITAKLSVKVHHEK
jgi:large subunit ribosomal protein L9